MSAWIAPDSMIRTFKEKMGTLAFTFWVEVFVAAFVMHGVFRVIYGQFLGASTGVLQRRKKAKVPRSGARELAWVSNSKVIHGCCTVSWKLSRARKNIRSPCPRYQNGDAFGAAKRSAHYVNSSKTLAKHHLHTPRPLRDRSEPAGGRCAPGRRRRSR